jgi:hypothetical protein
VCTEHTFQELMRLLSSEHTHQFPVAHAQHLRKNSKIEKVISKYAEHRHNELIHALRSAHASGT